jgi:H+-translocating NAD(P) transhydrogenase
MFVCKRLYFARVLQNVEEPAIRGIPYKKLTIGVPKETFKDECRVAVVPATVQNLVKKGFTVNVEQGAGVAANFNNAEYVAAGANVTPTADVFSSNIVLKVFLIRSA